MESAALSLQDAHNVAILVGSNNVLGQPNSDGFTGAAELGLALQNTGKNVFYVTHDQQGAQAMRKLLADMGHPVSRGQNEVMVFDSTYGTEAKLQSNTLLDEFGIDHVVAVDVPGRNAEGLYSDPRGFPIADVNSPLDEVVRIANQRADVTTIGIGSDGNEVGMAGVHASGDRTATIPTEHSITAWNSSLGAQALGIEVNRLNGTPVKNQPTEWQRETALETLLSSGAYDEGLPGELRDATPGVKGYGPQVHAAMAKLLESQAGKPPGQIGYRFEAGSYRVVAAFDSSNGGILAAGNLAAALQHANVGPVRFVVVVDHGNAPYGRKDPVTQLPSLVNNALTATESIGPATGSGVGDVQVIAMACNTACTPTKSIYAKGVDVPVIDLIDTTVSEIISSGGAHPVSISTVTTAQSHAYGDGVALAAAGGDKSALSTQRSRVSGDDIFRWDTTINDEHGNPRSPSQITEIGALSWADIVNSIEHTSNDPGAQAYVAKEIRAIVDQVPDDATSVWLTCTHFPALKPLIQQALLERGLDIDVVDPMEFQASTMADVLHSTAPQDGLTPTPLAHGINRPPKVILTTGSENKDVPGSARALSGRKDALVFHVPTFDPSSPELQDVQAYIHGALSADGSPYDPLLVSFNSRSIAKLHDNGRVEAAAIATKNANNVVILTNFNVGEGMPETDGPPGAAALGRAYATVGKEVTYVVSDEPAKTVLRAALREFGVLNASIEVFSAGSDAEGRVRAEHLLKRLQADAVVAVEVPGRTEETGPVNMRGVPIGSFNSPLYEITLAANRTKGIVTIGVFDGGNEIGAGNVSDRVPLALDGKTVMASDIPVDYHVAAWNSNFGADTLAIEVLRQHGMLDHAHTAQELVSSIEATMQAGAVDGVTRGSVPGERIGGGESGVDGFSPWVHGVMHDIQMRNALNRPEPRAEFPVGPQPQRPSSPRIVPTNGH
ncbi:MAG: DUF4392 domain-containing protein [Cytophagales bacterium]|nr:DUF4392 domain-containing protein [Rhizobacter sp.]